MLVVLTLCMFIYAVCIDSMPVGLHEKTYVGNICWNCCCLHCYWSYAFTYNHV